MGEKKEGENGVKKEALPVIVRRLSQLCLEDENGRYSKRFPSVGSMCSTKII